MYFLVGRAFQNQSVMMRAFPQALAACRSANAVCVNNNTITGSVMCTPSFNRDFSKWTRPVQPSLISSSSSTRSTTIVSKRHSSGDHVTLWTAERILSGILVPLIPLAVIIPSQPIEYLIAFGLTLHSHWGIEAIVVDYVRPSVFGPLIPKIALAAVYGLSAMTLGGLLYFIYADVGLVTAMKMLWKL